MEKIYELQHRALEKMTKNTCEIARVLIGAASDGGAH